MTVHRAHTAKDMRTIALECVKELRRGDTAVVIALSGELGAGKTTFVQEVAKSLGVSETVASPTFVIEKVYQLEDQIFERLIHIDAYRLKNGDELLKLGWKETAADASNLIFIEWPEKVTELIPAGAIRLRFDIEGDARIISTNGGKESS